MSKVLVVYLTLSRSGDPSLEYMLLSKVFRPIHSPQGIFHPLEISEVRSLLTNMPREKISEKFQPSHESA